MPGSLLRKHLSIGLDIGRHGLKFAVVDPEKGEILDLSRHEIIPNRLSHDQTLEDRDYRERITALFMSCEEEWKELDRRVITAIQGEATLCRYLEFPPLTKKELEVAVPSEALKFVPFSLDEIFFSYIPVPQVIEEKKKSAVFFVGAQKKAVEKLETLLKTSGIEVERMEVPVLALTREFSRNHSGSQSDFFALVDLGFKRTQVVVVRNGYPYFAREISVGGSDFTYGFQMGAQSSWADSELHKISSKSAVEEVPIQPFLSRCASEIKKSIDFFKGRFPAADLSISKVFLSGGTAMLKGFPEYLSQVLEIPTEVDRWDKLKYLGKKPDAGDAAIYKIAVGLALEG